MKVAFALFLLLAGLLWNNLWKLVPAELAGHVWSASSATFIGVLLWLIAAFASHWAVTLVCLLLAGFALQVLGCTVAFIVKPWPVDPSDELCSAGLHAPVGLIGLWVASVAAQYVYARGKHG